MQVGEPKVLGLLSKNNTIVLCQSDVLTRHQDKWNYTSTNNVCFIVSISSCLHLLQGEKYFKDWDLTKKKNKKSCGEVAWKVSEMCWEPLMRKVCSVCELWCENRLKIQIVFQRLVKSCFKHQWNRGLSFCVCPSHLLREVTWASEGLPVKQRKEASMGWMETPSLF